MRIIVIGAGPAGLTAAIELQKKGHAVTVSVATDLGAEALGPISCRVLTGRLDRAAMEPLVKAYELVKTPGFPVIRIGTRILIPVDAFKEWLVINSANV